MNGNLFLLEIYHDGDWQILLRFTSNDMSLSKEYIEIGNLNTDNHVSRTNGKLSSLTFSGEAILDELYAGVLINKYFANVHNDNLDVAHEFRITSATGYEYRTSAYINGFSQAASLAEAQTISFSFNSTDEILYIITTDAFNYLYMIDDIIVRFHDDNSVVATSGSGTIYSGTWTGEADFPYERGASLIISSCPIAGTYEVDDEGNLLNDDNILDYSHIEITNGTPLEYEA